MPQVSRHICTGCGTSIFNVMVNGVRTPLVLYFVVGQPPDTGPALDINAPGVAVPSFVREIMATPVARIELCMVCVAKAFGVPCVEATADPMLGSGHVSKLPDDAGALDDVERFGVMHERTLFAFEVARGEATPLPVGRTLPKQAAMEAYMTQPEVSVMTGPVITPKV